MQSADTGRKSERQFDPAHPITIIGAGVMGLAVAAELTARDIPVRIVDRAGEPGPSACSWWAGGMLAPDCESEAAEEPVTRLGRQAVDWWSAQGVPLDRKGSLVLALGRDRRELDRFARRTAGHQEIDETRVAALEPDLEGRFRRALYFADEAHLDPRAALRHLHGSLSERGVPIGTDGAKNNPGDGPYIRRIDCRGFAARDTFDDLRGVKGEMLVLYSRDIALNRPVRLLHPRFPLYIVPRGDGTHMLGATQIEARAGKYATVRSVLELLTAAYALHPAFGEAEIVETGVDSRPAYPDNLPRIRRRGDTLFVNGLFRHGFLLSPAMARMTADYLLHGIEPEVMDEHHRQR